MNKKCKHHYLPLKTVLQESEKQTENLSSKEKSEIVIMVYCAKCLKVKELI